MIKNSKSLLILVYAFTSMHCVDVYAKKNENKQLVHELVDSDIPTSVINYFIGSEIGIGHLARTDGQYFYFQRADCKISKLCGIAVGFRPDIGSTKFIGFFSDMGIRPLVSDIAVNPTHVESSWCAISYFTDCLFIKK